MVYVYTRPRVEIMAMTKSPGPAVYKMPGLTGTNDHDPHSRFSRGPAHTFGGRRDTWAIGCGPGPCYYPSPKIYRDGHDGTPHYSLYARQKEMTMSQTPGPGAYCPESAGPTTKFRNPEYSFGTRLQHQRLDAVPAANSYTLPKMIGSTVQSNKRQAPGYSLTGRSKIGGFHEDLQKTPGPGAYATITPNKYKHQSPHYSLVSRNVMPGDGTKKPGPGAHSPEKVYMTKRIAPSHSFGIRHSDYLAPLIPEVPLD
ncbi:hypothetical protein CAPTEDRAFT_161832 [Capitella teleta]|uniref:Outer dense fiber protein 3 n=1 Tax=Capitella teleta TaxID=283909 RepID=R7UXM8_CAPTE|nr:hypothetical protein CAPTEDRAFT_161832 [Capitella teleta]|eukprot:ELU11338.1 hypothetical protein CAPTEDRAFT_161832 [Capitella teleta]